VGVELGDDVVPDESTILRFRHLLERHQLTEAIFAAIRDLLTEKRLLLKAGTIVDATIISAPSSTKNAAQARDPEMRQTRKGNQWYFGMSGGSALRAAENTLGERLLGFRRERGLSQAAFARSLGIDPGTLARWERGSRCPPFRGAPVDLLLDDAERRRRRFQRVALDEQEAARHVFARLEPLPLLCPLVPCRLGLEPLAGRERADMDDCRDDLVVEPPPDDLTAGAGNHDVERDRAASEVQVEGAPGTVLDAERDRYRLARADLARQHELEIERVGRGSHHGRVIGRRCRRCCGTARLRRFRTTCRSQCHDRGAGREDRGMHDALSRK